MARRPDVQYVRFYTDGNAARQPEPKPRQLPARAPRKVHNQKRYKIPVQPFAVIGLIASLVMLVMMIVGSVELHEAQQERNRMERYVQELTEKNQELTGQYEAGYDLESIERAALALGLVPEDQVEQIKITIPPQQTEAPESFWEKLFGRD